MFGFKKKKDEIDNWGGLLQEPSGSNIVDIYSPEYA